MRFVILFLFLLLCVPVYGEEIILDVNTPNEVLAVQVLIDHFDTTDVIVRTDPWMSITPAFAIYAELVASYGECAVDPLIKVLGEEGQIQVAAAIGLEAVGPAAIKAIPQLIEMLESSSNTDNILACGIIRGIGPYAVELVPLLQKQLHNDNFHVQSWACRALSSIGPGADMVTGELVVILKEGIASVRRNAAIALGNIARDLDGKSKLVVTNALRQTGCDYSAPVRVAAMEALSKLLVITEEVL